jgi:ubiquinol-cytochrome c reductase cytochrome b subunit
MGLSLVILFFLPFLQKFKVSSSKFDSLSQIFFWLFVADVILLGWLGSQLVEFPYVIISQIATIFYFAYFLVIIPFLSNFELKILKI